MMKGILTSGVLSMAAAVGLLSGSDSLAMDSSRTTVAERIGHGGSSYQSKSDYAGGRQGKVDVVERIGAGGSTYSSCGRLMSSEVGGCQVAEEERKRVDVIERIGAGGSTYSVSPGSVGELASR